ncbi:hypothetical protein RJG79_08345 [Mycoplasmatota bacterium WC44]
MKKFLKGLRNVMSRKEDIDRVLEYLKDAYGVNFSLLSLSPFKDYDYEYGWLCVYEGLATLVDKEDFYDVINLIVKLSDKESLNMQEEVQYLVNNYELLDPDNELIIPNGCNNYSWNDYREDFLPNHTDDDMELMLERIIDKGRL